MAVQAVRFSSLRPPSISLVQFWLPVGQEVFQHMILDLLTVVPEEEMEVMEVGAQYQLDHEAWSLAGEHPFMPHRDGSRTTAVESVYGSTLHAAEETPQAKRRRTEDETPSEGDELATHEYHAATDDKEPTEAAIDVGAHAAAGVVAHAHGFALHLSNTSATGYLTL